MSKKIMHSAFFIIGLAVIVAAASVVLRPKKEVYDVMAVERKLKDFAQEKDNSIDLVFIGDSETYSAYIPLQMYEQHGFTSYVFGTSAQRLCDSYALLEEVFKTQKPRLVVLETNSIFRFGGVSEECGDKILNLVSKYIPALKYHSRLKTYMTGGLEDKRDALMKGFKYRTSVEPYTGGEWMKATQKSEEISPCNLEYLRKIHKLAGDNGAELIFVTTPAPACQTYERHNAVAALAKQMETDYIDLNLVSEQMGIDWRTDTRDGGNHLNYSGAKKVSDYVGELLSAKYALPDHREDESYGLWKQAYIDSEVKL
ncbi:MAG: hypothetical protein NC223_09555 [Butyrivibrio sp.]|nr:hypothetical protein [Butyrivibrio sp.]